LAAASGTAAANSSGTGDKAEARAGAHLAVSWFDDEDLEERVTAILRAQVKRHGLDPL
jgi:hypothetical protein